MKLYNNIFKRVFDLILSIVLIPFVLLSIFCIAPFIYFEDKGTLFYNAKRVGRNGKPFKMLKYRTMKANAPDIRLADGSTFNSEDDPRLTKVGKFLRKSSLDEIPQIINIILGDMSFIGPRPDPIDWLEKYTSEQRVFLIVKPGISGYNQAYFRNSADGATKIKNDIYYANNISFIFDFKILLKTIKTVIFRENLYIEESRGKL